MKIIQAREIGFCFGVRRALKLVEDNLPKLKKPVRMFGYLAHNEEVIKRIKQQGVETVNDIRKIKKGTLIITAHGISPKIKKELFKKPDLMLLDTTCPLVAKAQEKAALLAREGRQVLIFGDANHQEVLGLEGAAQGRGIVFSAKEGLLKVHSQDNRSYGLVSQTTQDIKKFKEIKKIAEDRFQQIKIFNTICLTTFKRQKEITALAKKVDLVLIIGSATSANTKRLCFAKSAWKLILKLTLSKQTKILKKNGLQM